MPVQINEVIIRAVVDHQSLNATSPTPTASQTVSTDALEAIIMESILETLREKNER